MKRIAPTIILLAAFGLLIGCRSNTTDVRGKVLFEGKPVTYTEVRLSGGGKESVTETNFDGRYTLSLEHPSTPTMELKVIKPGFVHDPIEFSGRTSVSKDLDVQLKRVHAPMAPVR